MAISDETSSNEAHRRAQADICEKLWKQADQRGDSSGISWGALLHPARDAKKSLIEGEYYDAARALNYLVVGAIADPVPKADGSFRNEDLP